MLVWRYISTGVEVYKCWWWRYIQCWCGGTYSAGVEVYKCWCGGTYSAGVEVHTAVVGGIKVLVWRYGVEVYKCWCGCTVWRYISAGMEVHVRVCMRLINTWDKNNQLFVSGLLQYRARSLATNTEYAAH